MLPDFQSDEKLYQLKWKLMSKGKNLDYINKILGDRWKESRNSLAELPRPSSDEEIEG